MSCTKEAKELTVCDITGEWGLYQWSVTLFAIFYSALCGITVVVGPLWTPDVSHICVGNLQTNSSQLISENLESVSFSGNPRECYASPTGAGLLDSLQPTTECTSFLYDDSKHGIMLTNTVSTRFREQSPAGRKWLVCCRNKR